MSKDVTANRFATICAGEESTRTWIALHLVGQENSDIEFWDTSMRRGDIGPYIRHTFSDMRQLRKKLVELLLALVQFTTASVVDSEQGHDAVNDEKSVFVTNEELGDLVQELHLVLGVDSPSVGDVVLSYRV
jgi:hypothetical protein